MATRMTPLTKGIIGLVLFGGLMGGYFHFKKEGKLPTPEDVGATAEGGGSTFPSLGSGGKASLNEPVGTTSNPLKVSIVEFQGYAGLFVANGGSMKTQPGSLFATKGVSVEAVIQNNVPASSEVFESNTAHCVWRTSDFWAQEQPNLRSSGHDGRAIMVVDNTQGADGILARDPAITGIEGLAGKKVGLLEFTPSHGLLLYALENSSLTSRQQSLVKPIFSNADDGPSGVRTQLESGDVDAIVVWDPDLSLALENVKGSHIIYSTKEASSLIYDVIVCDQRVLKNRANDAALTAFVDGWLSANKEVNANRKLGTQALIANEPMYKELASKKSPEYITHLFANLVLTDLAANARILGLAGDSNQYELVYAMFDRIYRGTKKTLKDPNAPVIAPSNSFDYRYVQKLVDSDKVAQTEARKEEFTFTAVQAQEVAKKAPVITKPVQIDFATNSAELTKLAGDTIDNELVPIIRNNSSAYIKISGNTDSTGSAAINKRISYARAQVVANYLVDQWTISKARLLVEGNGPDKPLCHESAPEDGMSLDQCRALNRTTRAAVIAR